MRADDLETGARKIARAAEPLPDLDDPAFGAAFDRFAEARIVRLGEASHGTSEFYRARAAIARRLVERQSFTMVAAEADWPDAAVVDRLVRGRPRAPFFPAIPELQTSPLVSTSFGTRPRFTRRLPRAKRTT